MLTKAVDWLVFDLLRMSHDRVFSHVLHFFLYDTVKIFLLLLVMISVVGFLRSFISEEAVKKSFARHSFGAHIGAALFGALTPFCSCSSIPIFLSFVKAGVPLGVLFTFLITSPLINEYLVVLMLGTFGIKITVAYVGMGLALGLAAGWILGKLKPETMMEQDMGCASGCGCGGHEHKHDHDHTHGGMPVFTGILSRVRFGVGEAVSIIKKIWAWILLAVALGALMHNFVPAEAIQKYVSGMGVFGVPLAVLFGVPLYGSCVAIVPIAVVLFEKGLPLGTTIAFMMAISALSLPEAVILRRAMKPRLIALFFGITAAGIVIIGYALNFLRPFMVQ
jgi:uncharacterized membrane protein YraQ (UPF0718 family)